MTGEHTGDFVLLNPLPLLRDEDGQYHCPAPIWNRSYVGDTDDVVVEQAMCGEVLEVCFTLHCPVPEHDGDNAVIETLDAGGWAIWSSWELRCPHGHVLATSAETDGSEDAQPFDSRRHWR